MGETTVSTHVMSTHVMSTHVMRVAEPEGAQWLTRRAFRPQCGLAALVAAAVVTAVGTVTAVEAVWAMGANGAHLLPVDRLAAALQTLAWQETPVLLTAVVLIELGLAMVVSAVPRRGRTLPMRSLAPWAAAGMSRANVRAALTDTAAGVPGITRARVRVRGRRVRPRVVVRTTTPYCNPARFDAPVRQAVLDRLAELDLLEERRVSARTTWRKG
ncbi:hypothetical protein Arub01_17980 [Actinomadura rubrobrunea]|uniref:DUF6286 domain-containing protein n=2 Tax=Actinomadura rubrobrunea TaxID=115335 RepID=A0A9W6PS50_9ACTN|nr:DUF6286 domain-containing protein [Actinomadura rubrobrunea]GLW63554.1 hypothetical protein Arub01_17980 [Actinomadura rubrobrunea]